MKGFVKYLWKEHRWYVWVFCFAWMLVFGLSISTHDFSLIPIAFVSFVVAFGIGAARLK